MLRLSVAPLLSVTVTVKLSLGLEPACSALTASALTA